MTAITFINLKHLTFARTYISIISFDLLYFCLLSYYLVTKKQQYNKKSKNIA